MEEKKFVIKKFLCSFVGKLKRREEKKIDKSGKEGKKTTL